MKRIVRYLDKTVPAIIDKLGPLLLTFKNERNKLVIFYFHGLYENFSQKDLEHVDTQNNITISQFGEFIEYFLDHKYHFISPDDLLKGLKPDAAYAMITFDDGYFNNILALEVLKKYKVPATFFLTTKNIAENRSYWWDIVFRYRIKQGISLNDIRKEQQHLKTYKYKEIEDYIINSFGSNAYKPLSDIDRPFTESEVRMIAENPLVSIGNHTHNHAILTNYSREEIRYEFTEANRILSALTGKKPNSIAFPNGNYNNQVLEVARESGFQFAFTVEPQKNNLPLQENDFTVLKRFMATTENIRKEGRYYRLGHRPVFFYTKFKNKAKSLFKFS